MSTDNDTYPRRNWWGEDVDGSDHPTDSGAYGVGDGPTQNPGPNGTWKPPRNTPSEIIAHQWLVGTARILCKTTLMEAPYNGGRMAEAIALALDDDPDHDGNAWAMHVENTAQELTDPAIRPPSETAQDQRHRKRYNPETGYISGGETTSVVIQNRPLGEFIAVVNLYLEAKGNRFKDESLTDSEKDDARQLAYRLKRNQHENDLSDRDILAEVIAEVRE